ncbi:MULTISPECIES: AzlC family ABC transporter permease [Anaerostipes]|uniref:AzlC family ABC transporter permease n=1 Tax=Anaerostipes TaxID=207244 RepID=UPI000951D875|nr:MULTISPECIES: AzlC family ABC transporter permease [Anaerostipes]OLR58677.1 branched-chain amino acid ABC transporter permease [Anaerostipes sp. 494a]
MKAHDDFKQGLIDGIPIGLAYVAVSFAFGIAGVAKGIPVWAVTLISATCLTSAGQFAAIISMTAGGSLVELILSQFIINLRYSIMSIAIGQKLIEKANIWNRISMAFGVTDEIFAVSCGRPGEITPKYFYALMTIPWISWTLGTFLGATASRILPVVIRNALGIAIYGMLIGIIIPPAKKDRNILIVIIISMVISLAFHYVKALSFISSGFSIIICTLIAATIGAAVFPVEQEDDYEHN